MCAGRRYINNPGAIKKPVHPGTGFFYPKEKPMDLFLKGIQLGHNNNFIIRSIYNHLSELPQEIIYQALLHFHYEINEWDPVLELCLEVNISIPL